MTVRMPSVPDETVVIEFLWKRDKWRTTVTLAPRLAGHSEAWVASVAWNVGSAKPVTARRRGLEASPVAVSIRPMESLVQIGIEDTPSCAALLSVRKLPPVSGPYRSGEWQPHRTMPRSKPFTALVVEWIHGVSWKASVVTAKWKQPRHASMAGRWMKQDGEGFVAVDGMMLGWRPMMAPCAEEVAE